MTYLLWKTLQICIISYDQESDQLLEGKVWWEGPHWSKSDSSLLWPTLRKEINQNISEERKQVNVVATSTCQSIILYL